MMSLSRCIWKRDSALLPSSTPGIGAAQSGLELGAGLGLGQAMAQTFRETLNQPARIESGGTIECPNCHATIPAGSKFCPNCGQRLQA